MPALSTLPIQPEVINRLGYILVWLAIGIAARAIGLLEETWTGRLNAIAFYVALPALVFTSIYGQALGALVSPALIIGLWLALFGTALVAWAIHHYHAPQSHRGVATIQSYHTSVGFFGLPLVAATFGDHITAIASIVLGIVSFSQLPLTIFLLVRVSGADASPREELRRLVTNPVLAALVVGLATSAVGLPVPGAAMSALDGVAELALPIALLGVGASLPLDGASMDVSTTGSIVALKLGLMPLLAWAVFSLLGVPSSMFVAAVVMLAMPTAVSTFVYAGKFGGDDQFASVNIFATTIGSVGTLFVLLQAIQ